MKAAATDRRCFGTHTDAAYRVRNRHCSSIEKLVVPFVVIYGSANLVSYDLRPSRQRYSLLEPHRRTRDGLPGAKLGGFVCVFPFPILTSWKGLFGAELAAPIVGARSRWDGWDGRRELMGLASRIELAGGDRTPSRPSLGNRGSRRTLIYPSRLRTTSL